jgi:hypothetical protein
MCASLCANDLQENRDETFPRKRLSKGDTCNVRQSHGCTDHMTRPLWVYATPYRFILHPVEEHTRGHKRIRTAQFHCTNRILAVRKHSDLDYSKLKIAHLCCYETMFCYSLGHKYQQDIAFSVITGAWHCAQSGCGRSRWPLRVAVIGQCVA